MTNQGINVSANMDLDGNVRVWHFSLDLESEDHERCDRALDDEERDRSQRYRFKKHCRRFVASRGTLRMILGHYSACDPESVCMKYGKHGKPYLVVFDSSSELKFSVSNSGGLGAVAVSRGTELGLDLEKARPNPDHNLIVSHEFSSHEKNWFLGLPEDERAAAFFDLWTCKEAYLKGKGLGLNTPLNQFSISLSLDMPPQLAWSKIDSMDPQRWQFHRLEIKPGYFASLAVNGDFRGEVITAPWHIT